ncbi:uncharacterized protein PF3D7_1120000-like [Crassostrea angulata]|uniref:uncharacterized protein PF3D7_1120000-like n=1 Tax=Magallana angulata TaxID=2784310 RepID=UPI0022B20EBB|nr:uncharacterized protein PF3D7_1120000-like [Crassostrea angulata]
MDHRICFGNEALSSMMDERSSLIEKALRYMEETRMEIVRNFQLFLKDYEAEKQEIGDERRRTIVRNIQMELMTKFIQREDTLLTESIAQLQKETEDAKRKIQEAWNTESKRRLVNQIHEDLWTERRIRNPQRARIMMDKVEGLKINLQKLQEELINEIKEREKYRHVKETYQRELLTKFEEKEKLRQMKKRYLRELMTKIEEKKEICQRREELHHELMKKFKERERLCRLKKACQNELMSYHRKKQAENECFVPRKLFLFNIDTFVCPPMPQCEPQKPKNEEVFIEPKDDSWQTVEPLSKAKTNSGCRQSLRSRLKKFFGRK